METIEKILLFGVILLILALPITMKIAGASDLPKLVEQDGFCKIKFGEDWNFNEDGNYCYKTNETKTFTEYEFRNMCPRVNILDLKFYSICFHRGDSR